MAPRIPDLFFPHSFSFILHLQFRFQLKHLDLLFIVHRNGSKPVQQEDAVGGNVLGGIQVDM